MSGMMDEAAVESLRRDIGEKMARDGEPLHENASDSVREGFRRGAFGFGSNVNPRKFGIGANHPTDWKCVCGNENRRYLRQCYLCGTRREYSEDTNAS